MRSISGSTFVDEICHYHTAHLNLLACVTNNRILKEREDHRGDPPLATGQGAGQHPRRTCHAPQSGALIGPDAAKGGGDPTPFAARIWSIVGEVTLKKRSNPRGEPAWTDSTFRAGPMSPRVRHLQVTGTCRRVLRARANFQGILRKEVIQPQVPLRLPCYDLVPITGFTFGACLAAPATSDAPRFGGLTGGVYKAQEHIHRGMLIRDY